MTLPVTGISDFELSPVFNEMRELLAKIASQSVPASPPGMHFVDGTLRGVPTNLRVTDFVFGVSAAAAVTLLVGTRPFVFLAPASQTIRVPFSMTIAGGTDLSVSASAGTLGICYLIYEPD